MIEVDWERFAGSIRTQAIFFARSWAEIERELGISHARMLAAAKGKPVGTEIFLTLCQWMQANPLEYVTTAKRQ